jgi:acetyl/propionyl-CoA carboxylase alpha subunit
MHVLNSAKGFDETIARARREAAGAFGDERLILERYLPRPRHVEVQLLGDRHGNLIHLGERECSLQRRHQKVIEEAPSPAVNRRLRKRLGEAAIALARSAGYESAGTAEFLLADDGSFYFLELNARLQVEHPVTELVAGRDLVADQLAVAAGARLPVRQEEVELRGHAIEARLYAEDPWHAFLPATGEVLEARWPGGDAARVDVGVGAGDVIGTRYDPLLAKLIAVAEDRKRALDALDEMLDRTSVVGVTTNRGFLRWLIADRDVRRGALWTTLIDERWAPEGGLPDAAWPAAASALAQLLAGRGSALAGFRLNAAARVRVAIDDETRSVEVPHGPTQTPWAPTADDALTLDLGGRAVRAALAPPPTVEAAVRGASHDAAAAEIVTAPMPGTVIAVRVAAGDEVEPGQVLVVLEAMKMENTVPAPAAGRVERVLVGLGQQVQRGETLVELA